MPFLTELTNTITNGINNFYLNKLADIKEFNRDYVHNAIFNRIKKAKKQAKNVILEIPAMVDRRYINSAIESYFTTSSKDREIWIIWKNKLLKYKKR